MAGKELPDLGELERQVMVLVWRGAKTADEIRERLDRTLKESTVRTVLRRLEDKGYVTHSIDGRTYIYAPAEARQHVAAKAVKRIVDWFCNGSVEDVLVGLVDTDVLNKKELQAIAEKIAKAKKGKN